MNQQGKENTNLDMKGLRQWLRRKLAKQSGKEETVLSNQTPLREQGISCGAILRVAEEAKKELGLSFFSTKLIYFATIEQMAAGLLDISARYDGGPDAFTGGRNGISMAAAGAEDPVAVVGIGCKMPGGIRTPEEFWNLIYSGRDVISEVPDDRWPDKKYYAANSSGQTRPLGGFIEDVYAFDADFFGISPREAIHMDPQQRLIMEACWEALEDAAIAPRSLRGSRTGVFMGASACEYGPRMFNEHESIDFYTATGTLPAIIANRVSYFLSFTGPSMVVDTACSASLLAVHMARQSILSGECETALAGGINLLLSPALTVSYSRARLMAPDGHCKTFDAAADGYVRSEGMGIVVMKRLSAAISDGNPIYGILKASAANHDGYGNGLTVPNGRAQQEVILSCLSQSGLEPSEIGFFETHGTGTRIGDPIEFNAMVEVLGQGRSPDNPLILGAVKTSIGHLEHAAGVAGLIKLLLAVKKGEIPPNLHLHELNPLLVHDQTAVLFPSEPISWNCGDGPRTGGVTSLGIGGTNIHAIVQQAPQSQPVYKDFQTATSLLPLSGKSRKAMLSLARNLLSHLEAHREIDWSAVCKTMQVGRDHFDFRACIAAQDMNEGCDRLRRFIEEGCGEGIYSTPDNYKLPAGQTPSICFAFSGQGSQYPGMAKKLAESYPIFKSTLKEYAAVLDPLLDVPLMELLYSDEPDKNALLEQTAYTQPALLVVELALAATMNSYGLHPDSVMGHSVGEYAAMCVAGGLEPQEALRLIVARGKALASVPSGGGMYAVFAAADEVSAILKEFPGLVISAFNGPGNTVVSGTLEQLREFAGELAKKGLRSHQLTVSHAFHSPAMGQTISEFMESCEKTDFRMPILPVFSNVTGKAESGALLEPGYWCKHIQQAVLFSEAADAAAASADIFVEIGPHPVLCGMGMSCHVAGEKPWIPLLNRKTDDCEAVAHAIATLYTLGVSPDWDAIFSRTGSLLHLPTYPFEHEVYRYQPGNPEAAYFSPAKQTVSLGKLQTDVITEPTKIVRSKDQSADPHAEPVQSVAEAAAKIMHLPVGRLPELEQSLISQGFDSLMAMQLKSVLDRHFGHAVALTEFLRNPSIKGIAACYARGGKEAVQELSLLSHNSKERFAPFPLTDIQYAYWVGRDEGMALGGNGCQVYIEVETENLDLERLESAIASLVARHDMLRMVIDEDGRQRVRPEMPPYKVDCADLSHLSEQARAAYLETTRKDMSQGALNCVSGPLFEIKASKLDSSTYRLHLRADMLAVDGLSLMILARELSAAYFTLTEPALLEIGFRDYVEWSRSPEAERQKQAAREYWHKRLEELPGAPALPIAKIPQGRPRFKRYRGSLPAAEWAKLRTLAASENVTPSTALLAAFGTVLAAWSEESRFSLNLTFFDRPAIHPQIDSLIGDFTTLVLLGMNLDTKLSFAEFGRELQERVWDDIQHSRVSAIEVLRELRSSGKAGGIEIAPVVFTSLLPLSSRGGERGIFDLDESLNIIHSISQTPQVWLDHQILEQNGSLVFYWDAIEGLFPEDMLEEMLESYTSLLHSLAQEPAWHETPQAPLPPSHAELVCSINPQPGHSPAVCLQNAFEKIAERQPELQAIISPAKRLTYGELDRMANGMAHKIHRLGVENRPVGILLPKGWEQVVAVLATLKAGCAYLPLDPELPMARLRQLLSDSEAQALLTDEDSLGAWSETGLHLLEVTGKHLEQSPPKLAEDIPALSKRPAYIIYTSGSTGAPKGVFQNHSSVVNTITDMNRRFSLTEQDVLFGVSNLSFDLSVYDLFGSLSAGASICLPEDEKRKDPAHWLECISKYGISVWNSAPALMQMLTTHCDGLSGPEITSLRLALLSGDWIPPALPLEILKRFPAAKTVSLGGATEAAIWSVHYQVNDPAQTAAQGLVPYGYPLENQTIRPLDQFLSPRPIWVPGTLYIGGIGLAEGYWNDPQRTSERFINNPKTGERLYNTGDTGRYLPDGSIEFLGRKDAQVKIRGHRIELGEIESALRKHPGIEDAVVSVAGDDAQVRSGTAKRLFAHVICRPGEDGRKPDSQNIKAWLAEELPEYMIPADIRLLEAFPLTANGKVDRKALAQMFAAEKRDASPRLLTKQEKLMAAAWSEILGTEAIGADDNFFTLGGDSLLGTRLATLLRQRYGITLRLSKLFSRPTVAELAPLLKDAAPGTAAEPTSPPMVVDWANRYQPFPLTDIQNAYWMGRKDIFELGGVSAHCYLEVDVENLDRSRLAKAWSKVVQRHELLRSRVLANGTMLIQEPCHEELWEFTCLDLTGVSEAKRNAELAHIREEMSTQLLDLEIDAPYDIRLTALPGEVTRVHFDLDNIVADAWSLFMIMREWAAFYNDKNFSPKQPKISFRDYVLAEKALTESAEYLAAKKYWTERLDTIPPAPELPLAVEPSSLGKPSFRRLSSVIDATRWESLKKTASARSITPSALLLTAYGRILARWSKSERLSINLTLFNRLPLHDEVDSLVGDFTSLDILETDFKVFSDFASQAAAVQRRLAQDLDNRLYSGVSVMRDLSLRRGLGSRAVMPVVFTSALTGGSGMDASVLGAFGKLAHNMFQTPQVWLDHQVYELNGDLVLNWDSVQGLFPENMLEDMFECYIAMLEKLANNPDSWESVLTIELPQRQREMLADFNNTSAPVRQSTLHGLFLEQAERSPERTAIAGPDGILNYSQLREYATKIAYALLDNGVLPSQAVALVMERGWQQSAAALGVMMAGGVYLPIQMPVPENRLHRLMEGSGATLAITCAAYKGRIPSFPSKSTVIELETVLEKTAEQRTLPYVLPNEPAYVIYTSGSTGNPKGVLIPHQGAVNTILDMNSRFQVGTQDKILGVSSFGFDLSVYDMFGIFAAGGTLVLPKQDMAADPADWLDAIVKHHVSIWNSAPQLWKMLLVYVRSRGVTLPDNMRLALLSGDWIPKSLPEETSAICPGIKLISLGGATEASIWSVLHEISGSYPDMPSIPYGRPMLNQSMHVLNAAFENCPEWVAGDLYIGGFGLAIGYLNDQEKTENSFITHKLNGVRLYRTGDLARMRPEGFLEFMGRADYQLKIRGHRVEPGEIEVMVKELSGADEVVVLAQTAPSGDKHLHCFLAGVADGFFRSALLEALHRELPAYMIPESFNVLETFPLTVNGKVDRQELLSLLAKTASQTPAQTRESAITSSTSDLLQRSFAAILERDMPETDANFFELGATSFHIVQVQAQILEKTDRNIPVRSFFQYPTISQLADHLDMGEVSVGSGDQRVRPARPARAARRNRNGQIETSASVNCKTLIE